MPPPSNMLTTEDIRVLLVQARGTEEMERQEQMCFLERCHLHEEQLRCINVIHDSLQSHFLDSASALFIGGAGEFSAAEDYPWMPGLLDFINEAVEREVPTFGSCWGHQVIARAFGGRVIYDLDGAELGSGIVRLTEAGRRDRLFGKFPDRFYANMGHHDRVSVLPDRAVELAYNESQRNQAFRFADQPVYGTQFHSELDATRERERLIAYQEYYQKEIPTEQDLQRIIDNLVDTSEVDGLLHDFLQTYAVSPAPSSVT